jgi:hypothetical protein
MILPVTFTETSLSFPFKVSANGTIATTVDHKNIWANKVRSVLSTSFQERVMFPQFGNELTEVFWNTETFAKSSVNAYVARAFSNWLPTLRLNEVIVSDIDTTGQLTISISYFLPNDEQVETSIGFVRISGNLPIIQETA